MKFFFPSSVSSFADHHIKIWDWIHSIQPNKYKHPLVAILPRGGGKSTTAELAVAYLGATERRKYCLYVRATQDQADKSVTNVAALFGNDLFAEYYPSVANRQVSKYGQAIGWRRNRLVTAGGFVVDAYGLDTALRGTKVGDVRPDFIILDDIDDLKDTDKTINRKIEAITNSVLPAGATHCTVFAIQNLLRPDGFFGKIVDRSADYLMNATVIGPIKAIEGLAYEPYYDQEENRTLYKIVAGTPTWSVQSIEVCETQMNTWGPTAFLREAQHEMINDAGMFAGVKFQRLPEPPVQMLDLIVVVDPAVTSGDDSDCQAICVIGRGVDLKYYIFHSIEQIMSPKEALSQALDLAIQYRCGDIFVEVNQGGDLWSELYDYIVHEYLSSGKLTPGYIPELNHTYTSSSSGSKVERARVLLGDYEVGKVVHILGTHEVLERALLRFPDKKPFDLVDVTVNGHRILTDGVYKAGVWGSARRRY